MSNDYQLDEESGFYYDEDEVSYTDEDLERMEAEAIMRWESCLEDIEEREER